MIRVDKNEQFIITVALLDENTNQNVSGQTVYYDIRDTLDVPLSPPASGVLNESSIEPGIYRTTESVSEAGTYIIYATCSGFNTNIEELIVNEENIYDVAKQTQNYNISVEDVVRTTASGFETTSQLARNVPYGYTDYLLTWIKADDDVDWSNPVASGIVYAHYKNTSATLPYKMGGPF
jgi:hypothetical protein